MTELQQVVVVTMPDQSRWAIPARCIAHQRAAYQAERETQTTAGPLFEVAFAAELAAGLADPELLLEWSAGMDWTDVRDQAVRVEDAWMSGISYDSAWRSAPRELDMIPMPVGWPPAPRAAEAVRLDPAMVGWLMGELSRRYAGVRLGREPRTSDEAMAGAVLAALTAV